VSSEPVAPNTGPAPPRRRAGLSRSHKIGSVFVLPGQLLMAFLVLFPALVAIYIAFTSWSPTNGTTFWHAYQNWHWFDGYREAFTSGEFWSAVWRTVLIMVVCTVTEMVLGFGLALLLLKDFRGRGLVFVYFLLPMMVVPAVSGFIFQMLFQVDGPINGLLSIVWPGDVKLNWLSDPSLAIWGVMIADIWQWTPLMFLIFLSGLVALPEDQMNAARILGAGFFPQFTRLIIPMMRPILLIAVIIRAMEVFKLFDPIIIMTQGGPGTATETLSVYLYRLTSISGRWGYACAVALIVLIALSIVAKQAIKPIERAQNESLEELMTAGGEDVPAERIEDAIDAGARA
jgi:multiple sugar transport system permease protein